MLKPAKSRNTAMPSLEIAVDNIVRLLSKREVSVCTFGAYKDRLNPDSYVPVLGLIVLVCFDGVYSILSKFSRRIETMDDLVARVGSVASYYVDQ